MEQTNNTTYDYVIIGSGFGGSVSALRLAEKGYRVLVLEKGRRFQEADFPKTNWQLKRWLWVPLLRWFGPFKMTFMRHVSIFSGVGVGGGSLVYANTLPVPGPGFFASPSWHHLADWESELAPHYKTAQRMLGAVANPNLEPGDLALRDVAAQLGKSADFSKPDVAVFFGEPGVEVPDPYFGGEGPARAGCQRCGRCMTGCPHNAKNTLTKNYLYLAEQRGARIQAEAEVVDVRPAADGGYIIDWVRSTAFVKRRTQLRCGGVVFAGGVLGTVPLLLKLKASGALPDLSDRLGTLVRTNSESLLAVTAQNDTDYSKGIAIGSFLKLDEHSHVEIFRYGRGSGFFRLLVWPAVTGKHLFGRLGRLLTTIVRHPVKVLRTLTVRDWAASTQGLLFMQSLESTLRLRQGVMGLKSSLEGDGKAPTPFIPLAHDIANRYARVVGGMPTALLTETLFAIPSTAHILGGACMGDSAATGVIDKDQKVFGYDNMYVCDGSAVSANIGVNPSLTIAAMTERAMSRIPAK